MADVPDAVVDRSGDPKGVREDDSLHDGRNPAALSVLFDPCAMLCRALPRSKRPIRDMRQCRCVDAQQSTPSGSVPKPAFLNGLLERSSVSACTSDCAEGST